MDVNRSMASVVIDTARQTSREAWQRLEAERADINARLAELAAAEQELREADAELEAAAERIGEGARA